MTICSTPPPSSGSQVTGMSLLMHGSHDISERCAALNFQDIQCELGVLQPWLYQAPLLMSSKLLAIGRLTNGRNMSTNMPTYSRRSYMDIPQHHHLVSEAVPRGPLPFLVSQCSSAHIVFSCPAPFLYFSFLIFSF